MIATAFLAGLHMLLMRRMIAATGLATLGGDLVLLVRVHGRKATLAVFVCHSFSTPELAKGT
jgi:hypothetical protein